MQEKLDSWYRPYFQINGNTRAQNFINRFTELLDKNFANILPNQGIHLEKGNKYPDLLNPYVLLLMLASFPQVQVRTLLKRQVKYIMGEINQKFPEGIASGPLFYPEIVCNDEVLAEAELVENEDFHSIKRVSEAVLIYNHYAADPDFLTSEGFNTQLFLSRFWASVLSSQKTISEWVKMGISLPELHVIASETLQLTLNFINSLKRDNSWMYEDLREHNKFSELKETACWKKIIQESATIKMENPGISDMLIIPQKRFIENELPEVISNYFSFVNDGTADLNLLCEIYVKVIFQCFGITISDHFVCLKPKLPAGWEKCKVRLHFRNKTIEAELSSAEISLKNLSPEALSVKLNELLVSIPGNREVCIKL